MKKKTLKIVPEKQPPKKLTERRSLSRLSLASEQFRLNSTGQLFAMSDLSEKGMGFSLNEPEDPNQFSVGLLIEGNLNLMRKKYPVKARVRSLSLDRVGCEFEKPSSMLVSAIRDAMDPIRLGRELKAIPVSRGQSLWYHGGMGTDLFFNRGVDGEYQNFILYAFQTFTEWDLDRGLSTGITQTASGTILSEGVFRHQPLDLLPDVKPDSKKLEIAKTILLSSKLPLELQQRCIRRLESDPLSSRKVKLKS